MALPDIASSQITKAERWTKLYRVIHHLFLRNEFIHKDDYLQMVKEMNARITTVEANANASVAAAVAACNAALTGHTHLVTTAGGPTNQAGVSTATIVVPATLTAPPVAPMVVPITANMYKEDLRLLGLGPAKAPLAGGISSDEIRANATSLTDVGV